jgi:hypothetical protein
MTNRSSGSPVPTDPYAAFLDTLKTCCNVHGILSLLPQLYGLGLKHAQRVHILRCVLNKLKEVDEGTETYLSYAAVLLNKDKLSAEDLNSLLLEYPNLAVDVAGFHISSGHVKVTKELCVVISRCCPVYLARRDSPFDIKALSKNDFLTVLLNVFVHDKSLDASRMLIYKHLQSRMLKWTPAEIKCVQLCLVRSRDLLATESAVMRSLSRIVSFTVVLQSIENGTFDILLKRGVQVYMTDDLDLIMNTLGDNPNMLLVAAVHSLTGNLDHLDRIAAQATRTKNSKVLVYILETLDKPVECPTQNATDITYRKRRAAMNEVCSSVLKAVTRGNIPFFMQIAEEHSVLLSAVEDNEFFIPRLASSVPVYAATLASLVHADKPEHVWVAMGLSFKDWQACQQNRAPH